MKECSIRKYATENQSLGCMEWPGSGYIVKIQNIGTARFEQRLLKGAV